MKRNRPALMETSTEPDDSETLCSKLESLSSDVKKIILDVKNIVKKEDLQEMITKTVEDITKKIEARIMDKMSGKINEKYDELYSHIKSIEFENESLRKRLETMEKTSKETQKQATENDKKEAIKLGNKNEQYSRKNNVKIMGVPEQDSENEDDLTNKVCAILDDQDVDLKAEQIIAIHRLPSKNNGPRPIIIKTINNSVKTNIMRKRKKLKLAGHRVADDVTKLNSGLINRLSLHKSIQSAWFFNGNVFGLTEDNKRLKFDILDNISNVINASK